MWHHKGHVRTQLFRPVSFLMNSLLADKDANCFYAELIVDYRRLIGIL